MLSAGSPVVQLLFSATMLRRTALGEQSRGSAVGNGSAIIEVNLECWVGKEVLGETLGG